MCWLTYIRGMATETQFFRELSLYELDDLEVDAGRTLRSIDFSHRVSERRTWDLEIGADELQDPDKYDFIKAFWSADTRGIVDSDDPDATPDPGDYITVTVPGGRIPIEFVGGHRGLPVFRATLTQRDPD